MALGPGFCLSLTPSRSCSAWSLVLSLGYTPLPCPLFFPHGPPLSAAVPGGDLHPSIRN